MNKLKRIFPIVVIISSIFVLQSCLNDDDTYDSRVYPNALVTIKQSKDKAIYLQLDDQITLHPINLKLSPFGSKEVRALVNYKEVNQPSLGCTKAVYINWMDSILTKEIAPDMGSYNTSIYGDDPVDIIPDWVTIAEDGYLTLRFRTIWGDVNKTHYVNLIKEEKSTNSYEVEFRHNASGDVNGKMKDALVAFNLNKLPNTEGKKVKLKLKWKSFNGYKYTEFDYCSQAKTLGMSNIPLLEYRIDLK